MPYSYKTDCSVRREMGPNEENLTRGEMALELINYGGRVGFRGGVTRSKLAIGRVEQ